MSAEFDLYCLPIDSLEVGSVVTLDGVDGFFDQYFDSCRPGDAIRFLVLGDGLASTPESASKLDALPLVEGRVTRCGPADGAVEILRVTSFGKWLRSVPVESISAGQIEALCPGVPVSDLIDRAAREGTAYWRSGAPNWRSLAATTAVLVCSDSSRTRLAVIRTNGAPGVVAGIELAG